MNLVYLADIVRGSGATHSRRESPHDILEVLMKRFIRIAIIIGIALTLALFSAALSHAIETSSLGTAAHAAIFFQVTATPQPEGISEVGSTDGIVAMGFVIVGIVLIPILLRSRSWMQAQ